MKQRPFEQQTHEAAPTLFAAGWCEEFGEFSEWLEEAGVTVESLPPWAKRAPVRVVALPRNRLFIERISRREYRDFRRMVARGEERLRAVAPGDWARMHAVTVTDIDMAKLESWKVNNDRCN